LDAADGSETITSNDQVFNDLILNGTNVTFQLTDALDVNGDLEINSGILDVNSSNFAVNVGGDFTNSDSLISRAATFTLDGSGAQSVTSANSPYYDLVVNKSAGTATLQDDMDVNNDLTISSGTLAAGSNTINLAGTWNNSGGTFTPGSGLVNFDATGNKNVTSNSSAFNNLTISKSGAGSVTANDNVSLNGTLTVTSGTFYVNGRALAVGDDGADLVSITGTLDVDAGAELQLYENTTSTVNADGHLRVVGTGVADRAVLTHRSSGNYALNVNGQVSARYATIEYTQGNGIQVNSGGTINTDNDFDNCIFQYGTGTSYLTIANSQNLTMTNVQFDSAASNRNTYNVNYTGSGQAQLRNYSGTMAGAHFENDNGSGFFGRALWDFVQTENVNNETEIFGNDAVITTTANLGNVTVELVDALSSIAPSSIARFFKLTPANNGTGTVRLYYSDSELNGQVEADLKIWQRKSGVWSRYDGSVDESANYVEVSGYGFSSGVTDTLVLSTAETDNSLPVELVLFESTQIEGKVELTWKTASEIENAYFVVERSENKESGYQELGQIEGHGTTSAESEYKFTDENVKVGKGYYYRLADYDFAGRKFHSDVIYIEITPPKNYALSQNYPNPFNPATRINVQLPELSRINVTIYNMLGQKVSQLANGDFDAGYYEFVWNSRNEQGNIVSSGMYVYVLQARSKESNKTKQLIKKMVLLR